MVDYWFHRGREETGRGGKRFNSTSSSTDEGCCSAEGDFEEGPSGDELREAQIKLQEHRLGLDRDISQRIDSQIVNRRLSDYQQHHFDTPIMDPIDPPSRASLFGAGGSGSSSSEIFESSFDSGCPPDFTIAGCFTSSLPSCTPPPPKSPSPIAARISRANQTRRASDGGSRMLFCQQAAAGDRPAKQRSIQGNLSLCIKKIKLESCPLSRAMAWDESEAVYGIHITVIREVFYFLILRKFLCYMTDKVVRIFWCTDFYIFNPQKERTNIQCNS